MKFICPNCQHEIVLPEAEESRLMLQIRDTAFAASVEQAVHEKSLLLQKSYDADILKLTSDYEKKMSDQKEQYEHRLKEQEQMVDYYRDLKLRVSTKMVGETLEQHCMTEFEKLRATAFPHAYFEKDNDARSGSKGDFIYREIAEDGSEILSIMFEMKNEMDTTKTKHKNEHFFAKLDKDRTEKKCEYAVLVSLLESDSELYNTGIVDVSHRYDKMYVIRPQFFIVMITVLRNAALRSLHYRRELAQMKEKSADATWLEQQVSDFRQHFRKNSDNAEHQLASTIEDIDKTISRLEKMRQNLVSVSRNIKAAAMKTDEFTVYPDHK